MAMLILKKRSVVTARIGDIFAESGLISQNQVEQALSISRNAKLPLGRVLVMCGYASDIEVENALEAQRELRSGKCSRDHVYKLIRMAHLNQINLADAASLLAWEGAYTANLSQLGKLLLAAGLVDEKSLLKASVDCKQSNMPLGGFLFADGKISLEQLENALSIMVLIRDGNVSRLNAVHALKNLQTEKCGLRTTLKNLNLEHVLSDNRMRLAELLIASNVVEEHMALLALESSIEERRLIGQVLIQMEMFKPVVLDSALTIQQMLTDGGIDIDQACALMVHVRDLECSVEDVLKEFERINEVAHFIRRSGLLDGRQMRELASNVQDFEHDFGEALIRSGLVTGTTIGYGAYCLSLVELRELWEQEAYIVFKHCVQHNVEPDVAIDLLKFGRHGEHRCGHNDLLSKIA
jgi:hypothetical protein